MIIIWDTLQLQAVKRYTGVLGFGAYSLIPGLYIGKYKGGYIEGIRELYRHIYKYPYKSTTYGLTLFSGASPQTPYSAGIEAFFDFLIWWRFK